MGDGGVVKGLQLASFFALPSKSSIKVKAKSMAVPGPFEVTTLPSITTGWSIQSISVEASRRLEKK